MQAIFNLQQQNKEKLEGFKKRIEAFSEITTLEEAKALSEKTLPVANEITTFNIGNARCTVVNKENLFRISLDTQDEFISYDFI